MPTKFNGKLAVRATAVMICAVCLFASRAMAAEDDLAAPADSTVQAALCQVVYPLDQTPEAGYRYMFLGNGFFINDEGYLVTAAHLLTYFRNGGAPYVLVGPSEGPRRMLEAPIVAADWEHDVAVLRASPNPFKGGKKITYLPLSAEMPMAGSGVMTASLRPADVENPLSASAPLEDFSRGEVIRYQFYRENGLGERELLLYDQTVVAGQSGSPLVSAETHGVIGVVVGRWLHPAVIPSANGSGHETLSPGAALRIHYAIGLLEQLHVAWHKPAAAEEKTAVPAEQNKGLAAGLTAPTPLSVVTTHYPPQALYGGEVLLDALVDASGKVEDVRVVAGDPPFLETVLDAVHTWTFDPATKDGRPVGARIGIVFQFTQSFLPHVVSREHKHPEATSDDGDHAALPTLTVEPEYPATTTADGSVAFYGVVDSEGELTSTAILRDVEALTAPAVSAAHHWVFVPGRRDGAKTESELIVVVAFRRPVT